MVQHHVRALQQNHCSIIRRAVRPLVNSTDKETTNRVPNSSLQIFVRNNFTITVNIQEHAVVHQDRTSILQEIIDESFRIKHGQFLQGRIRTTCLELLILFKRRIHVIGTTECVERILQGFRNSIDIRAVAAKVIPFVDIPAEQSRIPLVERIRGTPAQCHVATNISKLGIIRA